MGCLLMPHMSVDATADLVLGQAQLMQHLRSSWDHLSVPSDGCMSLGACIIVVARRKQQKQTGVPWPCWLL